MLTHKSSWLTCPPLVFPTSPCVQEAIPPPRRIDGGLLARFYEDVVPDVVWISRRRLSTALQSDGKLHDAPELAVEILSPGSTNERRDRELKLKLYSRRGVLEYWVVDWQKRRLEVYRRLETALVQVATLYETDPLESPLLPGFRCQISQLFDEMEPPTQ